MSEFDIYNFQLDDLHELLERMINQAVENPFTYIYHSLMKVPQAYRKRMQVLIENEFAPIVKKYKVRYIDPEKAEQVNIYINFEHYFIQDFPDDGWVDEWYIQVKHKGDV